MTLVGQKAPSFTATAIVNGDETIHDFTLEQYLGDKYVVFFFYPKDFSGLCPTEMHAFQEKIAEFKKRNCAVVACSTDSDETHKAWLRTPAKEGGIKGVKYPIVSDITKSISMNYNVLFGDYEVDDDGLASATGPMIALRGLFLIDKEGVVQHQLVNNFMFGRHVDETLRILDALKHFEDHGELCPANWTPSDS